MNQFTLKIRREYFLYLFLVISISCFSQQKGKYKVTKIDSTKSYYLIHLTKREKNYLVLSLKSDQDKNEECSLAVGKKYRLTLIDNKLIKGIPYSYSKSLTIEGKKVWDEKNGKIELKSAKNLNGMCLD